MNRPIVTLLVAVALAIPGPGAAQSERGSITGVVTDTTKAALPGVTVKVINAGTDVSTEVVSSASGSYSVANLSPGTYRIEASLDGFRPSTVTDKPGLGIDLNPDVVRAHLAEGEAWWG